MGEPEVDVDGVLAEMLDLLRVRPEGQGWAGDTPDWFGDFVFGGFLIAQATAALCRTAPDGRRIHSLHAYFLRPVAAGPALSYRVTPLRDGRSFSSRQLDVTQDGAPVLKMLASFGADTDGYDYDLSLAPDVPGPDGLAESTGPGPWAQAELGPSPVRDDGTRESTHRKWFRIPRPLPDDPHVHAALLGFATDWTGVGGRPLHLEGDITGMVSLDHAAWFHRPVRADEWLFFDVNSLVNAGGRGLLRGTMYGLDRRVAVSVAQEMRLTPVT